MEASAAGIGRHAGQGRRSHLGFGGVTGHVLCSEAFMGNTIGRWKRGCHMINAWRRLGVIPVGSEWF